MRERQTGHVYKSNHIYPFASYFLYPATKHGYLIVVHRWTNIHDYNPNTHANSLRANECYHHRHTGNTEMWPAWHARAPQNEAR